MLILRHFDIQKPLLELILENFPLTDPPYWLFKGCKKIPDKFLCHRDISLWKCVLAQLTIDTHFTHVLVDKYMSRDLQTVDDQDV